MQTPARDAQKRHADGTPGSHGTKNPTKKTWHDEAMERARKEVDSWGGAKQKHDDASELGEEGEAQDGPHSHFHACTNFR